MQHPARLAERPPSASRAAPMGRHAKRRTLLLALIAGAAACSGPAAAQTPPTDAEARALAGLHAAAWRGDLARIRTLLQSGADADARDAQGRTPLHLATHARQRAAVRLLLQKGAQPGLLDADRYDAVINQVGITAERQARFDFSDPYIVSKAVLIVKAGNEDIKGFEDLRGKRAAQSLTSNYGRIAEGAGATLVGTDGFDQSVQLVLTGRADATVNDNLSFLDFRKQKPDAPVEVVAEQGEAAASGIIVQKGNPELVAAINEALAAIKSDGTYETISQRYFGADVSR